MVSDSAFWLRKQMGWTQVENPDEDMASPEARTGCCWTLATSEKAEAAAFMMLMIQRANLEESGADGRLKALMERTKTARVLRLSDGAQDGLAAALAGGPDEGRPVVELEVPYEPQASLGAYLEKVRGAECCRRGTIIIVKIVGGPVQVQPADWTRATGGMFRLEGVFTPRDGQS